MDAKSLLSRLSPEKRALLASRLAKSQAETVAHSNPFPDLTGNKPERFDPFPLTDLQQAYWIGRSGNFEMGGIATHCYLEYETRNLDLDRLNSALNRVVQRHDMLRAVILPDGRQQVLENVPPYQISVVDLRKQSAQAVEDGLRGLRDELSHQVLRTDQWPLFDIRAALFGDDLVRVFLSLDALVFDAWSIRILLKEWTELYADPETPLTPLDISFRDYVIAENNLEKSESFQRARDYWKKLAAQLPPAPDLPLRAAPAMLNSPKFVRRHVEFPAQQWERLKGRATQAALTPTGLLMAAYAEVLALWSKDSHFTLNVPRFNRLPLHPQVQDLIGEFASFTLLEVKNNDAQSTFEERARRMQQQLWQDLDHSSFGGIKILRELAQISGRTVGAMMPVVFTSLANDTRGESEFSTVRPGCLGKLVFAINQSSQVWLDNHVSEQDGTLVCDWDSVDELFPENLSQDMLDGFVRLLGKLSEDDQFWTATRAQTSRLLLSPKQIEVRDHINANRKSLPDLLVQDLFRRQARQHPEAVAVVSATRTLQYGELLDLATRWGHRLRKAGARPNEPIAIVMEKGWEQVVAAMGTLEAGAPYLPLDAAQPNERLLRLLDQSQTKLILTQSWLEGRFEWPAHIARLAVDSEVVDQWSNAPLERAQKPDDLAYILYTSGSTGTPKGVMIAHAGVVNALIETLETFRIGPADRVLGLTALHHDMSLFDLFGVLGAGGTLILPQPAGTRDPLHWSDLMLQHTATLWNSVPAMMEMLLESAQQKPGMIPASLRLAFLGGDWIQLSIPERLQSHAPNAQVVSVGGPTETTLWNIWHPVEKVPPHWKSIPYGKPIANTRYYILNEVLEERPLFVPGEMYCAGVGVAKGYWQDQEKTNAKFIIHPRTGERLYRTGDLGCYHPDGTIEFVGRADFQVKINGQRIELGEIESALQQHPSLSAAVVITTGENQARKRLAAYFVPKEQPAPSAQELTQYLSTKLPDYMVPSAFKALDALPLTTNGKIDRQALPPIATDDSQAARPREENSDTQNQITAIVSEVLQQSPIDPGINLLSYGANSIDMVRIGNKLETKFGFRPRMDQLFRLQTIQAVTRYYEDELKKNGVKAEPATSGSTGILKDLLDDHKAMLNPEEREAFKKSQPGLRKNDAGKPFIELLKPDDDGALHERYLNRRSRRKYSLKPISFASFSNFLASLRQLKINDGPRYLYASPGGLYPTQIYIHSKPGRIEGVDAGAYYYHPVEHRLIGLAPGAEIDRNIHIPFINTPIYDEAAFSVFLIAQMGAIAPSYGERSLHFVTLECGIISHLLETSAVQAGIGLCQIGSVDFDRIKGLFDLQKSHILIHSLVGGIPEVEATQSTQLSANTGNPQLDKAAAILNKIKQLSSEEIRVLLNANKATRKDGQP